MSRAASTAFRRRRLIVSAVTVAAAAAGVALVAAPRDEATADSAIDCATDRFDGARWREDMRTLAGMVEPASDLTRSQYMARIIVKCLDLKGRTRREIRRQLGPSQTHPADRDWSYSLGELRGREGGAEYLTVAFDERWRVRAASISRGTQTSAY